MRVWSLLLLLVGCGRAPDDFVVGGFSSVDPASPSIVLAQEKVQGLLREKTGDDTLTIGAVTSAKEQVVAGMNYELVLDLSGAAGEKSGVVVVAYYDLKGEWALTSVEGL